ncbi:MAG: flagellar basal body rod C-terminal domain-containing protein [Arenimonas sp.]|jgi:flagellar basal-body rod protein FlgC
MSIESIMEATRAGLAYERMRLDVASRNIASANMPIAATTTATRAQVDGAAPSFGSQVGASGDFSVSEQPVATRAVHDPGHPMADAKGMVHYPATDLVQEMTTLVTASRGYEANVRAFNLLRGMMMKAMEIGAK